MPNLEGLKAGNAALRKDLLLGTLVLCKSDLGLGLDGIDALLQHRFKIGGQVTDASEKMRAVVRGGNQMVDRHAKRRRTADSFPLAYSNRSILGYFLNSEIIFFNGRKRLEIINGLKRYRFDFQGGKSVFAVE